MKNNCRVLLEKQILVFVRKEYFDSYLVDIRRIINALHIVLLLMITESFNEIESLIQSIRFCYSSLL